MATDSRTPTPMTEADLHAFVDGLLDDARRQAVQDHLDRHPQAAREVHDLRAQRQALRGLFAGVADEAIPERLNLRRIAVERAQPARRAPVWRIAAALALTTGLGAAGGWSWADKGLGYSLVGNDGALDLHPLADEARRQVRLSL